MAASRRIHRSLLVDGRVTASGAHMAAVAHVAGLDVIDQEMVLRLAAIVELASAIVDDAAHQAFLPLEDAHAAAETSLRIEVTKVAARIAFGFFAVLGPILERFMGLLAGEPDPTIGTDDDLGVNLALSVNALEPLPGKFPQAGHLVHENRLLLRIETQQPAIVAVA